MELDKETAELVIRAARKARTSNSAFLRKLILGGATGKEELLERMHCSPMRLAGELRVLLDAGLILRAAGDGEKAYVPALPPESTTVADCCRKLDLSGAETGEDDKDVLLAARETLENFSDAEAQNAANRKIFELCP